MKRLKPKSEFNRNVLTLMSGTTIAQALPLALSPILTRLYTPDDFGVFALFLAITALFSSIASGRYEFALMLVRKDEDAINLFALGFIIITFSSLSLFLIIFFLHDAILSLLNNQEIGFWLYFVPVTIFFIGMFNLLSYFNNRKQEYKDIANATILKSVVLVIVQLILGTLKSGAAGLISAQIISQFFANVKLVKNILKDKILIARIRFLKMIAVAKKYRNFPKYQLPHTFLNTLSSNIPVYLFSSFFYSATVGFYALSIRVVFTPLMIVAGANAKVYNQKISEIYNKNADSYSFTTALLKSLLKKIVIPFLVIVFFAPEIFAFIFGEEWREAGVYTQILSPWLLLNILVSTVSFIPSLLSMQKKAFLISIIHTAFSVISILVGVYFSSIYIALFLYMSSSVFVLSYNLSWMLKELKRGKE